MKNKILILLAAFAVLGVFIAVYLSTQDAKPTDLKSQSSPSSVPQEKFEPRVNEAGGITVSVTPRMLEASWDFEITLDTHSGELTHDITALSVLRDEKGNMYKPISWEGNPSSGHHREGILRFHPINPTPQTITLEIRDVGTKLREFRWEILPL